MKDIRRNLVLELLAEKATNGITPGVNPSTTIWKDMKSNYTASLAGFNYTTTSGWVGDGSEINPYRLKFDGVNDYVATGYILDWTTDFTIETECMLYEKSGVTHTSVWGGMGTTVGTWISGLYIDLTDFSLFFSSGVYGQSITQPNKSASNLFSYNEKIHLVTIYKQNKSVEIWCNGIKVLDANLIPFSPSIKPALCLASTIPTSAYKIFYPIDIIKCRVYNKILSEDEIRINYLNQTDPLLKHSFSEINTIGDFIPCKYESINNTLGNFSIIHDIYPEIPLLSSNVPNGTFYWVMTGYDYLGRKKLIADRNIQHSISWDTLNANGLITENKLLMSGDNLATGKTLFGDANASNPLSNAIDNNISTQWLMNHTQGTQESTTARQRSITVDLAIPVQIKEFVIQSGYGLTSFDVEVSDDNINFTKIHSDSMAINSNKRFKLPKYTAARYFSISNIKSTYAGASLGLSELQLFSGEYYSIGIPTGGVSASDKNNDWDKIIVESSLNGAITPGDNNIWNWNNTIGSWTTTTGSTSANRVRRGYNTGVSTYTNTLASSTVNANTGFRPILYVDVTVPKVVTIEDIYFSNTAVSDNLVNLNVKATIFDKITSANVPGLYEIYINGTPNSSGTISSNKTNTIIIPNNLLNQEQNIISVKVLSEGEDPIFKQVYHILYREDIETLNYTRALDIDNSITKDASLTRVYTKGIGLETIGTGQISIPIPTIRKGFMQSIVVEDNTNATITYQVSTDGLVFKGWNGSIWDESTLMNSTQINALTSSELNLLFPDGANAVDFIVEATITTANEGDFGYIKSITVNYSPNQGPIFVNPVFAPDSIHAEFCTFTSNVKDYEGDSIECRVSIKKAGEAAFYIADDWKPVSSGSILRAYNQPYFNIGTNIIKIECKDQRGVISEWTSNLVMTNTRPTFIYSYNEFGFIGTIDDPEGDSVRLRITINNNVILSWTNYKTVPYQFKYEWDTSLINVGVTNVIKVDVEDVFKESITENISITGQYKNILFEDENGDFYTNDKGEVLKTLDFGRLIVGDTNIPIFKLVMRNFTNYSINNIILKADRPPELPEGTKILIGTSISPFNGVEELHLAEAMNHANTRDIFIQVKPETGRGIPQTTIDIIAEAAIVKP